MGILQVVWWFFPFLCQSLPNHGRERDIEESMVEKKNLMLPLEVSYSEQNDTVCGSKARTSWGNLETHGLLREYEAGFLDSVKESWEEPHLFGTCLEDKQSTALMATKQLSNFLADPQGRQLVIMHLHKVKWEPGVSMHFQGSVQESVSPILQHLHLLIGVFFLGKPPVGHLKSKVTMSGGAFSQPQVVCMSPESRYLVLKLSGTVKSAESGNLKLHISFHMKQYPEGLTVPATESEQYLFGMDENCLTKITPVILMIVGHHAQDALYPSIVQTDQISPGSRVQSKQMVVPPRKKDDFLETLSHFSTLLMTSNGKASSTIYLSLDPEDDNAGDLRPQLLNITEIEALEWLVESQEPLVFLFLPGSKNVLASRIQGRLNGTLLEKITEKMQVVLEDLKEILSTAEHIQVLRKLLNSCYGYFNISYLITEEEKVPELDESKHRKLHSLMLLKMLQTVRAAWQDRKKLSRQNRGADLKPHCHLQELNINLKLYAEYKDIHFPEEININNCVGPCRFPQTTQNDYQAHVILLIQLQERRQSVLERPPCCVPVRYQEQWLMVVNENGIKLQLYPNMVAKECGCR